MEGMNIPADMSAGRDMRNETERIVSVMPDPDGPQVAFCLMSDSLRKGRNLITAGPDRRDGCSGETSHSPICRKIIALIVTQD